MAYWYMSALAWALAWALASLWAPFRHRRHHPARRWRLAWAIRLFPLHFGLLLLAASIRPAFASSLAVLMETPWPQVNRRHFVRKLPHSSN
jgi:hypothetical protein